MGPLSETSNPPGRYSDLPGGSDDVAGADQAQPGGGSFAQGVEEWYVGPHEQSGDLGFCVLFGWEFKFNDVKDR